MTDLHQLRFALYDGTEADKTVTLDANGDWKAEFDNLPVNKDGSKSSIPSRKIRQDYTATYSVMWTMWISLPNTHIEKPKPSKIARSFVKRHGPKTGDMTNIMLSGAVLLVATGL